MNVVRTITDVRRAVAAARGSGSVGFVPTMGALHAGHVSLFARAREQSSVVVVSVFVNPTQFNDPKDLALYPRPESEDARLAEQAGVDFLFMPMAEEIYPQGFATMVDVAGAATGFEGAHRPGHFNGVATVCLKLFEIVQADRAYFGQKDAQQVAVVKQLVRDFAVPLEIIVGATLRDPDGLAMSSRNVRLSPEERRSALVIPAALRAGLRARANGADPAAAARAELGGLDVDYVDVANWADDPTLVIAARAGATRLIDNVPLLDPLRAGLASDRGEAKHG